LISKNTLVFNWQYGILGIGTGIVIFVPLVIAVLVGLGVVSINPAVAKTHWAEGRTHWIIFADGNIIETGSMVESDINQLNITGTLK
jgi:hypothetical protein